LALADGGADGGGRGKTRKEHQDILLAFDSERKAPASNATLGTLYRLRKGHGRGRRNEGAGSRSKREEKGN